MLQVHEIAKLPAGAFTNEPEGAAFMNAFAACGLPDFELGFLQVTRAGKVAATTPYFVTQFRLGTMVTQSWLKWLLKPFSFRIASVGHPSTDIGRIEGEVSAAVLSAIDSYLRTKAHLVVFKMFTAVLPTDGFATAQGLPIHVLNLTQFAASMRSNLRKNIRKRLEKSAALRFEFRDCDHAFDAELLDQIYKLYLQTEARAGYEFETLPRSYFSNTLSLSQYQLAFLDDRLIGFIQVISRNERSTAKYIGMDYSCNQPYGLYFSLIIKMIESLQTSGCESLELGATSAYFKRLLGAQATATTIYYRHTWPAVHKVLAHCQFLLEPNAEELG